MRLISAERTKRGLLTDELRGRAGAPDQSRGCTLSPRARGDTTEHHGPLQRLLDVSRTIMRRRRELGEFGHREKATAQQHSAEDTEAREGEKANCQQRLAKQSS